MELQQVLKDFQDNNVNFVLLGLTDIDGVIRGKYVDLDKFSSLIDSEGGFCDCVFGWDVDDQLYDINISGFDSTKAHTGWHTGFPDTPYRLVASTQRKVPSEDIPYFVGEFVSEDSAYHELCPRSLLRRVIDLMSENDLYAVAGFEYEFFVFDETAHSIREKNFRDLKPLTPGSFGYSVLRAATGSPLFADLLNYCRQFNISLEGLHCETGPGVWEAALNKKDLLESADRANLFKTFSKVFFQQRNLIATFMAKWSMNFPGQSGHFHFSINDGSGNNLFANKDGEFSETGRYAVGGMTRYLPEWLPMLAPTINSYTRLVKGAWAPTAATWGYENRTSAIRAISGGPKRCHIENRIPGADSNPYLVAAATLAAAHRGIKERIEPPDPISGNAYDIESDLPPEQCFAPTLRDAAVRMSSSSSAAVAFGENFVKHFTMTRMWESLEMERHVTDWQLARYFEVI